MHLGGHMIVLTLQEMSSRPIIHPDSFFCLVLNPHFLHLGHEPIPQVGILGIMGKRWACIIWNSSCSFLTANFGKRSQFSDNYSSKWSKCSFTNFFKIFFKIFGAQFFSIKNLSKIGFNPFLAKNYWKTPKKSPKWQENVLLGSLKVCFDNWAELNSKIKTNVKKWVWIWIFSI